MQIILSVISDDKPGVVKLIAKSVASNNGNWLDCQLSRLGGKFAGVICVDVEQCHLADLKVSLTALAQQGVRVVIDEMVVQAVAEGERVSFSASAPDRAGLVLELSQALSERSINVIELTTQCTSMPYSGDPLFCADGIMILPNGVTMDSIFAEIESVASNLGMDFTVSQDANQ